MRILHVANYDFRELAGKFFCTDFKWHNALTRLGHFVYPFSYRDETRNATPFQTRKLGIKPMQKKLIKTAENLDPDLLLLAHSELITNQTIKTIKSSHPSMKIAMYWIDPLWPKKSRSFLAQRLPFLDVLFATTGGNLLSSLHTEVSGHVSQTTLAHLPNPVDEGVESLKADVNGDGSLGLLFCGRGAGSPDRKNWPQILKEKLKNEFSFRGTMGSDVVLGMDYWKMMLSAKAGLNLSQRNDVTLYTSERIAQLAGNGVPVITPKVPELNLIFPENTVCYVDSAEEAASAYLELVKNEDQRRAIGKRGRECAHLKSNAIRLAQYMLDLIEGNSIDPTIEWKEHIFKK